MKADYHMHTSFSSDAECTPEEMIEGAVQKGLTSICITDHMDKDYDESGTEFILDTDRYFEYLKPLQEKYKDIIDVRIGVEAGIQPHLSGFLSEYLARYPFDFVIGSVHLVGGVDPYYGELFRDRSDARAYQDTFAETIKCIKTGVDFDVLGHLDYIVRYGKEQEKEYIVEEYAEQTDEILRYLIENGKGIEINTAGLKYGLSFAHPHPKILKRYKELGGEIITIGSDAHRPEHIAYDFWRAKELLKENNFKYYTEFKGRKPVFVQVG